MKTLEDEFEQVCRDVKQSMNYDGQGKSFWDEAIDSTLALGFAIAWCTFVILVILSLMLWRFWL